MTNIARPRCLTKVSEPDHHLNLSNLDPKTETPPHDAVMQGK